MRKSQNSEILESFPINKNKFSTNSERSILENQEKIQILNIAKKENLELKNEMKKLNKSLDSILKKQVPRSKILSPVKEDNNALAKKLKGTELLIDRYKKEIEQIKQTNSGFNEKIGLDSEIIILQNQLKVLESENNRLLKENQGKFINKLLTKTESKNFSKELSSLKEKQKILEILISEDEKKIFEQKKKISEETKKSKIDDKVIDDSKNLSELEMEILKLQEKIEELENTKKNEEELWRNRLKEMKNGIEAKKNEIEGLEIVLKEKDKACRMKKILIKTQQRENRVKGRTSGNEDLEEAED